MPMPVSPDSNVDKREEKEENHHHSSSSGSSNDEDDGEEGWKTEEESEDEMGEAVMAAHKLEDPLNGLNGMFMRKVTLKNGAVGVIQHFKVQQLSDSLLKWIMDLMTRNMAEMYKKSTGGWKPRSKKREMTGENSRYVIISINDEPVAFSHFQFDMDYGREVLYCYETQVEPSKKSCGLGKLVMGTLEKIAKQANLPLVVLTVFKFNLQGLEFFKRVGYSTDETCPEEHEKKDYLILSKTVSK